MLPEASQFGLTPQLASLLLNQNNPSRDPLEAWDNRAYKSPLEAGHLPEQPPMPSNHHLTQLEILQAISQIGVDNIPPELMQQLRESLGECNGLSIFPVQQQMPGSLPLSSMPAVNDMSRLPLQDQAGFNEAFRYYFELHNLYLTHSSAHYWFGPEDYVSLISHAEIPLRCRKHSSSLATEEGGISVQAPESDFSRQAAWAGQLKCR